MPRKDEVTEVGNAVLEALEMAAREVLEDGRGSLSLAEDFEGAPVVRLAPRDPGAAPLEVWIDTGNLINCSPGRNGMSVEVFSKDLEELASGAGDLAAAVVAGTYSEWVNDAGAKSRIAAQWVEDGKTFRARLNAIFAPSRRAKAESARGEGDWRFVTYEAY